MKTREINVGGVRIGGENKVAIQSMTTSDTKNVRETVGQILRLEQAGCDIVRSAIYDEECAGCIPRIMKQIHIPFVADVHFDANIAVAAIENGVSKIRINPGNIGSEEKVMRVVDAAKAHGTPIRVGANAGSLSRDILDRFGGPTPEALIESALANIRILEKAKFDNIVVSIKSSSVPVCVKSYRGIAKLIPYPLHLGVTEAGTYNSAIVKSSVGLGALLLDGIGDTIRVSITGDPVQEVYAARDILKSCGLIKTGVEIISCPTCARCTIDIEKIVSSIEKFTQDITAPIKVAVMGCEVNGPGEAREADLGIAGGKGEGLLFAHGEIIRKIDEFNILPELRRMILELAEERKQH
ncbi:4-hydroxy-3-methylbut-2-en-1-yl diphosphate synthase (flavodoxin) [Christensenellaceae bacterium]|nr:4-hydroxy-3-methylbut-2-en-1-yl diphosphate synthase (flavodoxin) [Christensenellaceae bacterium]BDF61167.1 4-hydroxy-3-methylbut-2-en-1-yl diphosphate synthase (flavodoxin) [Christensenellaceae bacterium]